MRERFLQGDIGITGCNFAVANTGSIVMVTNEGNGRMVSTLPRVQITLMGMERIVPSFRELDVMLNLLARSATGQRLSSYTTILTPVGYSSHSSLSIASFSKACRRYQTSIGMNCSSIRAHNRSSETRRSSSATNFASSPD